MKTRARQHLVATFSIAAHDPRTESWGVAVASRFLACGGLVPWARAGAGCVATQAMANFGYGPAGLAMMERGVGAEAAVAALLADDDGRDLRQVGVVDGQGRAAAFSGEHCVPWAGHLVGAGFSCQGNMLGDAEVLAAMARSFERSGDEPLPERLVATLEAAQAAGGDVRGQQSAALVVVRAGAGFLGLSDRAVDLRVDDHPRPIGELARLLALHRTTFG
jgi:uncharacterized Ntn-hydrolase superfamily protein